MLPTSHRGPPRATSNKNQSNRTRAQSGAGRLSRAAPLCDRRLVGTLGLESARIRPDIYGLGRRLSLVPGRVPAPPLWAHGMLPCSRGAGQQPSAIAVPSEARSHRSWHAIFFLLGQCAYVACALYFIMDMTNLNRVARENRR